MGTIALHLKNSEPVLLSAATASGRIFATHQQVGPVCITEVHVYGAGFDAPIVFPVDLYFEGYEGGQWESRQEEDEDGELRWSLEFVMTTMFGKTQSSPLVLRWDHERNQMIGV